MQRTLKTILNKYNFELFKYFLLRYNLFPTHLNNSGCFNDFPSDRQYLFMNAYMYIPSRRPPSRHCNSPEQGNAKQQYE
jgi:hypothetical protein